MAPPTVALSPRKGRWGKRRSCHATQSRSTSAESVPAFFSDDFPVELARYPSRTLGLPEYDYPIPWSIEQAPELSCSDFPAPLVVKNTFVDFDIGRPESLQEYFEERRTQSCPASGICLFPGSEDLFASQEAIGKLVAAQTAPHKLAEGLGMADSKGVTLQLDRFTPVNMLDRGSVNFETPRILPPPPLRPPAFQTSRWEPSTSHSPLNAPVFDMDWQSPTTPAPLHAPHVADTNWQNAAPPPTFDSDWYPAVPRSLLEASASGHPRVLDLLHALSAPLGTVQEKQERRQHVLSDEQFASPDFPLPPNGTREFTAPPVAEFGSSDCPTMGSQGHWSGRCKPCAFFHTRGCGNGVLCPFCHLCDHGEKKRRAKEKQLDRRCARQHR